MKRPPLNLPFSYMDTSDRRVLSLVSEGFPCVPVLGLSRYRNTRPFLSAHRHPECIEISFCVRSSLRFKCEGISYDLLPGHMFVTQPADRHHLVTNPKGMFMYWMFFRLPCGNEKVLGLPKDESDHLVSELKNIRRRLFLAPADTRSLFAELFGTYDSALSGASRRLALRISLLRLLSGIPAAAQQETPSGTDDRLRNLAESIKRDPSRRTSVGDMARAVGLSESAFTLRFRNLTGFPPHAFIVRCRLDAVKRSLVTTRDSVVKIARDFGFSSSEHLAGQFKASFGVTMRELRKNSSEHAKAPTPQMKGLSALPGYS